MNIVAYLAHPVAPSDLQRQGYWCLDADIGSDTVTRACVDDNLASARRWLRWLVWNVDWAICAPWMPYVQALNDATSEHRRRGLRDDCMMAARCDAIVLCGGRVSSGMALEIDACTDAGGAVVDLTGLGAKPPAGCWRDELERLMREARGG